VPKCVLDNFNNYLIIPQLQNCVNCCVSQETPLMTFQSSPICHADGRFFFLYEYFVTLLVYIHVRLVMIQIVYLFYNSDSAGQSP
jgi:hypothetical protein